MRLLMPKQFLNEADYQAKPLHKKEKYNNKTRPSFAVIFINAKVL